MGASALPLALGRVDVAAYVAALFNVYLILILLYVVLSWVQQFRPLPYNRPLRATIGFIDESVGPYVGLFRRFIPTFGPLDISPIAAIIVLVIVERIVVGAIAG